MPEKAGFITDAAPQLYIRGAAPPRRLTLGPRSRHAFSFFFKQFSTAGAGEPLPVSSRVDNNNPDVTS